MLAEVDFTEVWTAIAAWHRKQEEEGSSNQSVQILVGPTADAAAGARSLAEILKCRGRALFNLTPVHSHSDLTSVIHSCQENGEENCFILVGCGGDIDLTKPNLFDFSLSQVHVVHNVRPFHLNNLRSEEANFFIWDRSEIELGVDTFFRAHAPSVKKRGRDGMEEGDDEEEEEGAVDPLTGRLSSRAVDWKNESSMVHLKEVEKNYYSTSGVGRSIADTFYGLSGHLKFNDHLYLWNTAVGLADLYLRNLLSRSEYDFRMQHLEVALQSLSLISRSSGAGGGGVAQFGADATNQINQGSTLPMGVKPPPAQLTKGEEHRPLLLRQWNLWDSLWHEPVIAAKLGTYNKQLGEETLRTLLAEVGVHVKGEAQKPWANLESKRRDDILRELLPRLGEKIGTEHSLSLPCLCRNKGHPETSSFDMVRLFNAVASSPMEARNLLSRDEASTMSKAQFEQELINHKRSQFWAGYDLLWDRDSSRREGTAFYKAVSSATSLYTTIGEATDAILAASNKSFISFQTSIHATLTDGYHQALLGVPARLALLSAHVLAAQVEKTKVAESGRSAKYRTPTGRPLFLRCPVPNPARAAGGDTTTTTTTTSVVDYYVMYFNSKQFSKTEPIKPIRELHNVAGQYNASNSTLVDPTKPELGIIRAVEQDELDRHVVLVKGEDVSQRFTEQVYLNLQTYQTRRRAAAAGH